jgi:hypothetical protein
MFCFVYCIPNLNHNVALYTHYYMWHVCSRTCIIIILNAPGTYITYIIYDILHYYNMCHAASELHIPASHASSRRALAIQPHVIPLNHIVRGSA